MAWNPSPEVAAVRDAARKIGESGSVDVDRAVLIYTTRCGQVGYVSYGRTKELCAAARRMADAIYDRLPEIMDQCEADHQRPRPGGA